ncbi:vegetative cell wall protein gp1-like [Cryptomeria japonica]|uniref:vegetative cell wall protein gp1-like n=1 Tax=Cryptomeria japonica TaxID=3369 RepID=UPI0027DA9DD3|nr:vegetative cell wall protein gp1-like [Cryptomeria japonica]
MQSPHTVGSVVCTTLSPLYVGSVVCKAQSPPTMGSAFCTVLSPLYVGSAVQAVPPPYVGNLQGTVGPLTPCKSAVDFSRPRAQHRRPASPSGPRRPWHPGPQPPPAPGPLLTVASQPASPSSPQWPSYSPASAAYNATLAYASQQLPSLHLSAAPPASAAKQHPGGPAAPATAQPHNRCPSKTTAQPTGHH